MQLSYRTKINISRLRLSNYETGEGRKEEIERNIHQVAGIIANLTQNVIDDNICWKVAI